MTETAQRSVLLLGLRVRPLTALLIPPASPGALAPAAKLPPSKMSQAANGCPACSSPPGRRDGLEDVPRGSPVPPILLRLLLAQVSPPPRPHCPLSQPWGFAQTAAADVKQTVHVSFSGLGETVFNQSLQQAGF